MLNFNIKDFLKRAAGFRTKELFFRSAVQESIKKHLNMEVPIESIKIRGNTIQLNNISQSARSALFIKKNKIIEEINAEQNIYVISDIR